MTNRHTLSFLLTLPCLASPALAQFMPGQQIAPNPAPQALAWSSMTRLIAGDFSGEGYTDAIQRRSNFGLHIYGPPVHSYIVQSLTDVIALSTVPGAGSGGRDAAILGGAAGLRIAELDPNASPPFSEWTETTISANALYKNPTRLHVVDMDGGGTLDLLMLSEDGMFVYIFNDVDAATPPTSPSVSFSVLDGPAWDIVPLDWDSDTPLEIGLVRNNFTGVVEQDGIIVTTLVKSVNRGNPLTRIAHVEGSSGNSRLISTQRIGGNDYLHWMDRVTLSGFTLLGNIDAVAIVTGDLDGDQIDDLVFSYQSEYELTVLYSAGDRDYMNVPGDTWTIDLLPGTNEAFDNVAWPCIADFDGDTDNDILFAIQQEQEIHFIENILVVTTASDYAPSPTSSATHQVDFTIDTNDPPEFGRLEVSFDEPAVELGHDTLQLVIWERDAGSASPHIANDAKYHVTTALNQSGPTVIEIDLEDLDLLNDATSWEIVARTIDSTSSPVEASGAWVGSLYTTIDAKQALEAELGLAAGSMPDYSVDALVPGGGWTSTVSTGIFIQMKLPCYQTPDVPQVPAPTVYSPPI